MNIVFIGPSGAGKGTQAEKIAAKFNLIHLSSGDLFRDNLKRQTELGLLAKKYMEVGELVPDEVTEAMIKDRLHQTDTEKGFLVDGFPRTKYQAKAVDEILRGLGRSLDAIIYLKTSDEEITINRIPGRLTCRDCQQPYHEIHCPPKEPFVCDTCGGDLYRRNDDTPERTTARLKVFHRQTAPVVDYYQESGKLIIIDGDGSVNQVYGAIVDALEAVGRQEARTATREETQQIQALKDVTEALSSEQASRSLDIVLLGAPGSGKGTQAERICKELDLLHVATGDLFRENLKNETELGRLAKTYMNRGELVPDDVTEAMVRERLSRPDAQSGFVLDGFPRTLPQAEALTEIMTEMGRRINGVLYIKVSDEEIVNRLSGRIICKECQTPFHKIFNPFKSCPFNKCEGEYLYQRDDDNPETVRARLKTFYGQTAPLIEYYRTAGLLIEIEGEGDVSEVTAKVLDAARNLEKGQNTTTAA